jgi:sugar lactone lactonase YvrE
VTGVEIALDAGAELGEGPTWDPATGTLVWVDILASTVHRTDPATGGDTTLGTDQHVGAAKPDSAGGLVVNLVEGVGRYATGAGGGFRWLARWPEAGVRGNDAAVDPWGRLWAGTMRYDEGAGGGRLRRLDPDGIVTVVLDAVTISNGIGWSPDLRRMYYIDTPTGRVDVFDVDTAGEVSGRREFVTVDRGSPDGLCVDADGAVWVSLWGGGAVHRYTPDGRLDREVPVPVSQPSACTFGGPDLRDLYITTARVDLAEPEPHAGALLVLPGAGQGLAPTPFRIP